MLTSGHSDGRCGRVLARLVCISPISPLYLPQVLIESSGISEPLPVAETFTFRDKGTGVALNDVASLHNLVTVVDAASIFEQLSTVDTLVDRGWHEVEGDKRTVAHLLCDQLEFADLLLLNKCDLVTAEQLGAVRLGLGLANPNPNPNPNRRCGRGLPTQVQLGGRGRAHGAQRARARRPPRQGPL